MDAEQLKRLERKDSAHIADIVGQFNKKVGGIYGTLTLIACVVANYFFLWLFVVYVFVVATTIDW